MLTTITEAASVVLGRLHRNGGREADKREDGEGQHVGRGVYCCLQSVIYMLK
jgi:hypothetical protein